tara:strand:+ start:1060 stop:1221 length:162 start_codon:yes stop_codon:yes gene_type:complete
MATFIEKNILKFNIRLLNISLEDCYYMINHSSLSDEDKEELRRQADKKHEVVK